MKTIGTQNYFVYILANSFRNVIYVGVTNDLERRLFEHKNKHLFNKNSFTSKYNCSDLIYWERFQYIDQAIEREKEIKKWRREKKFHLIKSFNPSMKTLNEEI